MLFKPGTYCEGPEGRKQSLIRLKFHTENELQLESEKRVTAVVVTEPVRKPPLIKL